MEQQAPENPPHEYPRNNEEITIVMGNETCDFDSVISSLVYAYVKQCHSDILQENKRYIPLLNMKREDKALKAEVFYFLEKYGANVESLVFRNNVDLELMKLSSNLEVILIDHHTIPEEDLWLKSRVVEVIDHRPLDPDWSWVDTLKTIEPVASCATLIAEKVINQDLVPISRNLLILLYGAILIDTWCLAENPKLYTEKDKVIVEQLERRINYPISEGLIGAEAIINRDDLFNDLLSISCDVSHLTVRQILKKDLKIASGIPISVLPMLVQEFAQVNVIEELHRFTDDLAFKGIVLIGVKFTNRVYAQDIAIFSRDKVFLEALKETLAASRDPYLQLNEVPVCTDIDCIKVFNQLNHNATRKQILPLIKEFMRQFTTSRTG